MNELFQKETITDNTDNTTSQDENSRESEKNVEKNATTGNHVTNEVISHEAITTGDPSFRVNSNNVVNAKCGCLIS